MKRSIARTVLYLCIFGPEVMLSACVAPESIHSGPSTASEPALKESIPGSGSVVAGPVDELTLRFSTPVRLLEVIVSGPGGEMPAMVESAGETASYSIPLPGLEAGEYKVRWKASAGGQDRTGFLSFKVK